MDMDSLKQDGKSKERLKKLKDKGGTKRDGRKMTIMIREVKG